MVYVVFGVVIAMFAGSVVAGIAGLADYMSDHGTSCFQNIMVGLTTMLFGGAVIVCCVYAQHSVDAYVIPAVFCAIGVPYLAAGVVGYRREATAA